MYKAKTSCSAFLREDICIYDTSNEITIRVGDYYLGKDKKYYYKPVIGPNFLFETVEHAESLIDTLYGPKTLTLKTVNYTDVRINIRYGNGYYITNHNEDLYLCRDGTWHKDLNDQRCWFDSHAVAKSFVEHMYNQHIISNKTYNTIEVRFKDDKNMCYFGDYSKNDLLKMILAHHNINDIKQINF